MNAVERLQIARVADYCVRWLKANRIKVLHVEGDRERPRIIVKYSPACDLFDDIVRGYERCDRGAHYCAWVFRFGCQIKWQVPAENPHKVGVTA